MLTPWPRCVGALTLTLTLCACAGSGARSTSKGAAPTAATTCSLPAFGSGGGYHPKIDPASFSATVDNPYYPLIPGVTSVYVGVKDGKGALDIVVPTARTAVIDGVATRVVEDRLFLDNALEERTSDYYAQDRCGNVWYFGEDTASLDARGKVVSTDGSFHAGANGARPGVFMQATPETGRRFRQEWSPGQAEDTFKAVGLDARVAVPGGRFTRALRTEETTALEPGVVDNKLYVQGIGEVVEQAVKGPPEALHLVEVIR